MIQEEETAISSGGFRGHNILIEDTDRGGQVFNRPGKLRGNSEKKSLISIESKIKV